MPVRGRLQTTTEAVSSTRGCNQQGCFQIMLAKKKGTKPNYGLPKNGENMGKKHKFIGSKTGWNASSQTTSTWRDSKAPKAAKRIRKCPRVHLPWPWHQLAEAFCQTTTLPPCFDPGVLGSYGIVQWLVATSKFKTSHRCGTNIRPSEERIQDVVVGRLLRMVVACARESPHSCSTCFCLVGCS